MHPCTLPAQAHCFSEKGQSQSSKEPTPTTNRCSPVYLPPRIHVSSYCPYRVCDVLPCLVRKPRQTPHQLAKESVALGFVRVELLELQAGWEGCTFTRRSTKMLPLCFQRQNIGIKVSHKPATSMPPRLAQAFDWDKPVQVNAERIAPSFTLHRLGGLHMRLVLVLWNQSPTRSNE